MNVYGCQFNILWEDKFANFESVQSLLHKQKIPENSLIVLPEMFATGFTMNVPAIVETINGPTTTFLKKLALERRCYVLGGVVRKRRKKKAFNEAVCMAPTGQSIAEYAKIHPFGPGGESNHYAAGDRPVVFNCGNLKVAVFICYDLRFPEVFRAALLKGAEMMIVISNWPNKRHSHWLALLQARAIENQAYVMGVNRCGQDPKLEYAGGSVIFDPYGHTVALAGERESIISAKLDPNLPSQWRNDFPALKDIRSDFLKGVAGRIKEARRVVKDYRKN